MAKPQKGINTTYMWSTAHYCMPEKVQDRKPDNYGRDTSPRKRPKKRGRGRSL